LEKLKLDRYYSGQYHSRLNDGCAMLFSFFLPLHQIVSTGFLILWIAFVFMKPNTTDFKGKGLILLLPAILFLCYGVSIFFSTNNDFSILARKLSLIVLPVIFYRSRISLDFANRLLVWFVYGLLAASIFCLFRALYCSLILVDGQIIFKANVEEGRGFIESILYGGNYFFGRDLSYFHQTVYFSMYLCAGIAILLQKSNLFKLNFKFFSITLFIIMIFLLSNKAGIVTLFAVLILYFLTSGIRLDKKVFLVILVLLGSLLFIKTNPRFELDLTKILNGELVINKNARYGFATRMLSWDASVELIKGSPLLGYGAGDTQEALNTVYKEKGYVHPLREQYNAHNQFLQSWLEKGLLGLIVFISIMGIIVRRAFINKQNGFLLLSIGAILMINALFESYLNRYSGISFFTFFCCLALTSSTEWDEN